MNGVADGCVWPDVAAGIDSAAECLAEDLGLTVPEAERVLAWHDAQCAGKDLATSARLLHLIFEWLTWEESGSEKVWRVIPKRMVLNLGEDLVFSAEQSKQVRISRLLSVKLLAVLFVLAPKLLDGVSESELAQRVGVTRSLVSHYVTSFSRRFGVIGRGMKAAWTREVFAAAQKGNKNRSGGSLPLNIN
jgi:hypothetical protein